MKNKFIIGAFVCAIMTLSLMPLIKLDPVKVNASNGDSETTFTVKEWGGTGGSAVFTNEITATNSDDIEAVMNNFIPSSGQIRGNKTTVDSNFYIFNNDAIPGFITSIALRGDTDDSNYFKNKMYAAVGTESQSSVTSPGDGTPSVIDNNGLLWIFEEGFCYNYFKLYSNEKFTNGSIKNVVITITYVEYNPRVLEGIYIDGIASKLEYKEYEQFDPSGLKVMGRYSSGEDTEITTGIVWEFDPEILSYDTTQVNVIAKVDDFVSPNFVVNNLVVHKRIYIPSILPSNFPTTAETGWSNPNGAVCYLTQSGLIFDKDGDTSNASLTVELQYIDGNYKYIVLGPFSLIFNMDGSNLLSIDFASMSESKAKFVGTYKHNHALAVTHPRVEPTCTENGSKEYYECNCGKYFSDEALTNEITDLSIWLMDENGGYIPPLGHDMTHHDEVPATCTQNGVVEHWTCSHESGIYYGDEEGTIILPSIVIEKLGHDLIHHEGKQPTCTEIGWEAYDECSRCDYTTYVEIPPLGHDLIEVKGKPATCDEDGYKTAYKCSRCNIYYADPLEVNEIGDENAYNAWKLNEGKIPGGHKVNLIPGVEPTIGKSGYKDAWKCSTCGQYYEDKLCTILIGNEAAYESWKTNKGYLPGLPKEGLSTGAIAGISIAAILLLLIIIYLLGYFFMYRKGKLDEKKIKVIYKVLPRGNNNLKENNR